MQQRFEPASEMDLIRDIHYQVKEINYRVERLETTTSRVEDAWQKQINALEARIVELEKFRFLFTVLVPPAWAIALATLTLEMRRLFGAP